MATKEADLKQTAVKLVEVEAAVARTFRTHMHYVKAEWKDAKIIIEIRKKDGTRY